MGDLTHIGNNKRANKTLFAQQRNAISSLSPGQSLTMDTPGVISFTALNQYAGRLSQNLGLDIGSNGQSDFKYNVKYQGGAYALSITRVR